MSVINCQDFGFLFEPNLDTGQTGLVKLCANWGGYTLKHVKGGGEEGLRRVSVPPLIEEAHAEISLEDDKLL